MATRTVGGSGEEISPLDIFLYYITASSPASSSSISEQIIFQDWLFVKGCRCHLHLNINLKLWQLFVCSRRVWKIDSGTSSIMDWTEENTLGLPGFGYFPGPVIELLENLTKVFIYERCLENWMYWSENIYLLCLSERRRILYVEMSSQ